MQVEIKITSRGKCVRSEVLTDECITPRNGADLWTKEEQGRREAA
jgi:hypothetical protein